ncbi:hypothetical protein EPN16_00690, partial [bacterium]
MKSIILFYFSYLFGSISVFLAFQYKFFSTKLMVAATRSFQYPLYTISFYLAVIFYLAALYFMMIEKKSKKNIKDKEKFDIGHLGGLFVVMGIFISAITHYSEIGVFLAKASI